jgi:hypothetical protein
LFVAGKVAGSVDDLSTDDRQVGQFGHVVRL